MLRVVMTEAVELAVPCVVISDRHDTRLFRGCIIDTSTLPSYAQAALASINTRTTTVADITEFRRVFLQCVVCPIYVATIHQINSDLIARAVYTAFNSFVVASMSCTSARLSLYRTIEHFQTASSIYVSKYSPQHDICEAILNQCCITLAYRETFSRASDTEFITPCTAFPPTYCRLIILQPSASIDISTTAADSANELLAVNKLQEEKIIHASSHFAITPRDAFCLLLLYAETRSLKDAVALLSFPSNVYSAT
jgi:hypothetical protein